MKKLLIYFLTVALVISIAVVGAVTSNSSDVQNTVSAEDSQEDSTRVISGANYVRTFYDEFEGTKLDSSKWAKCPEQSRQDGASIWDDDYTNLDGNGHLVLTGDVEEDGLFHCGAIRSRTKDYSKDLFNQLYGYFEIKVKLQSKQKYWTAFWLMPDAIDRGIEGGSDGTEIDIFEAFDPANKKINQAIHWDGYGPKHKKRENSFVKDVYDGQFHTFALEWTENYYRFYIDNKKTWTIYGGEVDIAECANYLKISLETAKTYWVFGPPAKEDLPDGITVDYVKVFQREDYLKQSETTTTTTTTRATTLAPTTTKKLTLSKPDIKLKAGKKQFTVSYKKVKNADKYKIYYRQSSAKKWKSVTTKLTKKTIKKLKKGKKYKVKVVAINGKVKSKFSTTKTIKVK